MRGSWLVGWLVGCLYDRQPGGEGSAAGFKLPGGHHVRARVRGVQSTEYP